MEGCYITHRLDKNHGEIDSENRKEPKTVENWFVLMPKEKPVLFL